MQVTLQLRPKEADQLVRLAVSERRTPRRVARRLLSEALAQQKGQAKPEERT